MPDLTSDSTEDIRASLDSLKIITLTDGEMWSARDLMSFAGYVEWRKFSDAINRAIASVNASGLDASDHFVGAATMVNIGSGARREVEDVQLTRYGCYILFQNADARKPEIAALQSYFAIQTRKQELSAPALPQNYVEALRALLTAEESKLELEARVAEQTPKAEAWDELASADGDYSVADAAKMLARTGIQTGPQRLFNTLSQIQWIFRGTDGAWHAYAGIVDMGYLTEKPQSHEHPRTQLRVIDPPQIRVTIAGLNRIRVRLTSNLRAVTA
jgi:phage antirepressor YoqD-like protein